MFKRIGIFISVLIICTVFLMPDVALASSYKQGMLAYEEQNYQVAKKHWMLAADSGDPRSQYMMGLLYRNGISVKQDDAAAADWYSKSASKNYAEAQAGLGYMYVYGEGVEKKIKKGIHLLEASAGQDHPGGAYNLATIYLDPTLVSPLKPVEAYNLFLKAAELGHADAANSLGYMLEKGEGTKKNDMLAALWYRISAEQGNPTAQYNLSITYYYGRGVQKNLAYSRRWMQAAAAQGHQKAQAVVNSQVKR